MPTRNLFKIKSAVWLYPGMSGWHFLTIPKKESESIKRRFGKKQKGWGSLPVIVKLGTTTWKTSIFPEKQSGTFLLPVKKEIRKTEGVLSGDKLSFSIEII